MVLVTRQTYKLYDINIGQWYFPGKKLLPNQYFLVLPLVVIAGVSIPIMNFSDPGQVTRVIKKILRANQVCWSFENRVTSSIMTHMHDSYKLWTYQSVLPTFQLHSYFLYFPLSKFTIFRCFGYISWEVAENKVSQGTESGYRSQIIVSRFYKKMVEKWNEPEEHNFW